MHNNLVRLTKTTNEQTNNKNRTTDYNEQKMYKSKVIMACFIKNLLSCCLQNTKHREEKMFKFHETCHKRKSKDTPRPVVRDLL